MSYTLGIDLGTTYTSAAVARDGRAATIPLGNHGASIPSVVFVQEDGVALTGDAAVRRGAVAPDRVAREFKRRIGDTQPVFIAGAPYSPEQLTARLLRAVFDEVCTRDGARPTRLAITHPANWGGYKIDLLHQAVQMSEVGVAYDLVTEPEAAAVFYAAQDAQLHVGDTIAIYDLGGGTFDAAVLAVTAQGFQLLGTPSGIERFGGIDLDAAVLHHVISSLGDSIGQLDPDDAPTTIALQRLREECTLARELLSVDTTATIPVLLPGTSTSVNLERAQVEVMARPGLDESVRALLRTIQSSGVEASSLRSVVLVGGTTRMPLVSQLLAAALQRPIELTSDPSHAVALGAALHAARNQAVGAQPPRPAPQVPTPAPAPPPVPEVPRGIKPPPTPPVPQQAQPTAAAPDPPVPQQAQPVAAAPDPAGTTRLPVPPRPMPEPSPDETTVLRVGPASAPQGDDITEDVDDAEATRILRFPRRDPDGPDDGTDTPSRF